MYTPVHIHVCNQCSIYTSVQYMHVHVHISIYTAGHIVTGDLKLIKDIKLRNMIAKGPNYREQNNINWNVNSKICKEAVSKYKVKWSKKEKVDKRLLNEWEITVHECIDKRIQQLRAKHINKRKKKTCF